MYVYKFLVKVSLLKKFIGLYQPIKVIPNKIFFEICKKIEKNQMKYPRRRTLKKKTRRATTEIILKEIEE